VIRDGKLVKDYSPASITRQVDSSLKNLELERLPLVQLHGVPLQGFDEALDTLSILKQQGKIELAGASCDGAALEYALSFDQLDVVMLTYNLIMKQAIKQIELAYSKGCGILVKSPLAHTLYCYDIFRTRKMSDVWYFLRALKNNRSQFLEGRKYSFINHIKGWAANEIALLYALQDKVSCVVTGTTDVIHMKRNINTFEKEFPKDIKQMIDAV
jgi:aryl-alcohol dehydrogenase-like predicted oxidoreductase